MDRYPFINRDTSRPDTNDPGEHHAPQSGRTDARAFRAGLMDVRSDPRAFRAALMDIRASFMGARPDPMVLRADPMAVRAGMMGLRDDPMVNRSNPMAVRAGLMGLRDDPMTIRSNPMAVRAGLMDLRADQLAVRVDPWTLRASLVDVRADPIAVRVDPTAVRAGVGTARNHIGSNDFRTAHHINTPRNIIQAMFGNAPRVGSSASKKKLCRKQFSSLNRCTSCRTSDTHSMQSNIARQTPANNPIAYNEALTVPTESDIVNALEECEAMMREEEASNIRAEQESNIENDGATSPEDTDVRTLPFPTEAEIVSALEICEAMMKEDEARKLQAEQNNNIVEAEPAHSEVFHDEAIALPTKSDVVNSLGAQTEATTMMKEEAVRKLRAKQKKKNETNPQKGKKKKSSSRPLEEFEETARAIPIATNFEPEPERVEANSHARSLLDNNLQELVEGTERDIVHSFRVPDIQNLSLEEPTIPHQDVLNYLELEHNFNNYFTTQVLPTITTERISLALERAKREFFKVLAGEQDDAASYFVTRHAKKKDDKVKAQKSPEKEVIPEKRTKKKRERKHKDENEEQ